MGLVIHCAVCFRSNDDWCQLCISSRLCDKIKTLFIFMRYTKAHVCLSVIIVIDYLYSSLSYGFLNILNTIVRK